MGTYESDSNPFSGLVATPPSFMKLKVKHRVEYSLTLRGRTLDGTVKRVKDGDSSETVSGLLALGDSDLKVLMVLNDDQTEINVMENPHGTNPSLYSIKRSEPESKSAQA